VKVVPLEQCRSDFNQWNGGHGGRVAFNNAKSLPQSTHWCILQIVISSFVLSLCIASSPVPGTDESLAKAKAKFEEGSLLYKSAKYKEALGKFEETFALRPHPTVTYNIGRCHEKMGNVPKALSAFREYLRVAPKASDAEAVSAAMASMEKKLSERGVQQFQIFVDPITAKIEIDKVELNGSPASIELAPGSHELVVSAPGFEPLTKSFVMSLAHSSEMTLQLREVKAADVPNANTLEPIIRGESLVSKIKVEVPVKKARVLTWVAAGLAAAAGGTGTAFGLMSNHNETLIKNASQRAMEQGGTAQNQLQLMGTNSTIANVSFVSAGVAGAAAVVLFFVEAQQ
jgi:tetratricopeptide (TPR) repeat protein